MKKVFRWILLVWTVLTIPYLLNADLETAFFSLLYVGLIIFLMVDDIKKS